AGAVHETALRRSAPLLRPPGRPRLRPDPADGSRSRRSDPRKRVRALRDERYGGRDQPAVAPAGNGAGTPGSLQPVRAGRDRRRAVARIAGDWNVESYA